MASEPNGSVNPPLAPGTSQPLIDVTHVISAPIAHAHIVWLPLNVSRSGLIHGAEATDTPGVGTREHTTDGAVKQTNGDNTPVKPVAADGPSEDKKPAESTESSKEHKPTGAPKSPENGSTPTITGLQESTAETNREQNSAGHKRAHEATSAPADMVKGSAEDSTEPPSKKRKITGKRTRNGNARVPGTTGGKQKANRSKKARDLVKKAIPTDGIGSRTRSRTKASS
ncbi:hypothetical protein BDV28DRAFT_151630 [Aspergillus coremiiformis]|uniref:Uncharacterized protein n=1 Tax=Aspergillus coremiiformis TaxID=138285 RepID=A0A5N6YW81_9EURO|nr:hypothetical protein BDV28DRAFT_151630 [Aspergillus coremiiformis]